MHLQDVAFACLEARSGHLQSKFPTAAPIRVGVQCRKREVGCAESFHEHAPPFPAVAGAIAVGAAATTRVGIVFHVKHHPCTFRRHGRFDTSVADTDTVFVPEQSVDAAAQGHSNPVACTDPVQPPLHRASGKPLNSHRGSTVAQPLLASRL